MENYKKAFIELIANEGEFKVDARDRMDWTSGKIGVGNLIGTKYGISAGTYPNEDIPNLTLDRAALLYKRDWWDYFKGDSLPYAIGFNLLDAEVNHGHGVGVKFLQQALGFTGKDVDGKVGPMTIGKLSVQNEDKLLLAFFGIRLRYFTQIKTWPTYGKGWANRISDNLIRASQL